MQEPYRVIIARLIILGLKSFKIPLRVDAAVILPTKRNWSSENRSDINKKKLLPRICYCFGKPIHWNLKLDLSLYRLYLGTYC